MNDLTEQNNDNSERIFKRKGKKKDDKEDEAIDAERIANGRRKKELMERELECN